MLQNMNLDQGTMGSVTCLALRMLRADILGASLWNVIDHFFLALRPSKYTRRKEMVESYLLHLFLFLQFLHHLQRKQALSLSRPPVRMLWHIKMLSMFGWFGLRVTHTKEFRISSDFHIMTKQLRKTWRTLIGRQN